MAIYGAGSTWGEEKIEMKNDFFEKGRYILGWNEINAKDLYNSIGTLKIGDIIYLKANAPGSRRIRVKGIGIVNNNFAGCVVDGLYGRANINNWESLFVEVRWLVLDEFFVNIDEAEGKLTNVRASSFYEEYLPSVQRSILQRLFP